ncbi:hypothetical protein [Streptomyces marincola]|uniref:hypothetical protein n=1 Tax=Streptomyces marincola TaxID=2878388 RepID=UPI001CF5B0E7|nr:hypothetical protein [Streptomyces marincola]UCM88061.1 hypothetical protein LC193_08885 [Streptomyces marincola]
MGTSLRKLSGDPECKNGACPALWGTADGKDYVVQGHVVTDPEVLARLGTPEGEAAVMVPAAVLKGDFRARR